MMKKTQLNLLCAATVAVGALAAFGEAGYRDDTDRDRGPKRLTAAEIIAAPRRATVKTPVPEDAGCFVGSGVYENHGRMHCAGFAFTYWSPEKLNYDEIVDLCVKEQVGNTLQFWQGDDTLLRLARKATEKGLYTTCIYSKARDGRAKRLVDELGDRFLGYDFGEHFTLSCTIDYGDRGETLTAVAEDYLNRVKNYVDKLHGMGWGNVMATSSNFALDYEVLGGTEIPCTEDYPFGDLTLASALNRGLYRQYDLPLWGAHLAHEWYSWLPHKSPYKMRSLSTAFLLKYMTGAKIMINESGNWQLQSSLAEDSPMCRMPIVDRKLSTKMTEEFRQTHEVPVLGEAKKKYSYIDYRSPVSTKYRKAISDFYAFCKEHPAPKGQPEATWALAKGNLDLGGNRYIPNGAICGGYALAKKNPGWMAGVPEMSWETLRRAVMPMPPMFAPYKNIHFSATPYGLCDVVSFAFDNVTVEHLLKNYKVLMFSGWNTCTPKQYRILCDYVKGGGKLVIGLCHLSTDDARRFTSMGVTNLVNGGDFTDLCGLKVVGETGRKYWATGPSTTPNCLGFVSRRRFGYMCLPLGKLEYVAAKENFENLAVDDEDDEPFIVRCRNGKGEVFLMNWWGYPAAADQNVGCSALDDDIGMVGYLYRYAAKLGRGNVWITGPDFENPDDECNWIVCSYFPDAGKICLLNLDYENEHRFVLQQFGDKDFVTLAPGEFRLIDTVKLDADEKLNVE